MFAGRNKGQLQAYDARNGKRLWSFQTGAGANSTASVFSLDGQEVVAFYAAGNALAGTAHGDELWLFGLDGTLGPVAAGHTMGAEEHAGGDLAVPDEAGGPPPPAPAEAGTIRVEAGEMYFRLSAESAPAGTVTFVVENAGAMPHDFAINGKKTPLIDPGKTARVAVEFPKAGKFDYVCTVPGHAAAGMQGTFTIR